MYNQLTTIRILFHTASPDWMPNELGKSIPQPGAIVSPNAGHLSYPVWILVIIACIVDAIPFSDMLFSSGAQWETDIKLVTSMTDALIAERRAHPIEKKDMLTAMIKSVDSRSGRRLMDTEIGQQLITFLIAGQETTADLLAFAVYHLCTNPAAYSLLQAEIDEVVGSEPLEFRHLSQLKYTTAVLRENLRLTPAAPLIRLQPFEDTVVGGKYEIKKE